MQRNFVNPIGMIEGFYGNPWPHSVRLKFPELLAELGLNTYVYCPKSDPYLRRRWKEDWPSSDWSNLMAFSFECHNKKISLGIGISPYEIYTTYTNSEKIKLRAKIEKISELNPVFICVLFDDMQGNFNGIASIQADIANDVHSWSTHSKVLFCPTYYSFDPILESVFGKKPINYHESLGELLHHDIGVLWTGTEVCSDEISSSHAEQISKIFKRQITLWDNYSANDGKERSKYLYLKPLPGRDEMLPRYLSGHLCNAMTQPELFLITLSGLSQLHVASSNPERWLERRLGKQVLKMLSRNLTEFETVGLEALSESRLLELINDYGVITSAATKEVINWLKGRYKFDPNCLTD